MCVGNTQEGKVLLPGEGEGRKRTSPRASAVRGTKRWRRALAREVCLMNAREWKEGGIEGRVDELDVVVCKTDGRTG